MSLGIRQLCGEDLCNANQDHAAVHLHPKLRLEGVVRLRRSPSPREKTTEYWAPRPWAGSVPPAVEEGICQGKVAHA